MNENGKKIELIRFGKNVKKFRKRLKLTQEELGNLAGLHKTYISSVEHGERNISLVNIYNISKALKCSVCDLVENL